MDRNLYIDEVLRILNPTHRELEPDASGARGFTEAEVRGIDVKNRSVTALVSTPNVDRYGELIEPESFRASLPMFQRNPVLIAGHRYQAENGDPTVIGRWTKLAITKEGLIGTCQFMTDDELAEKWWRRYQQKCMQAFSVGFISLQSEMRDFTDGDGIKRRLRVHTEAELLEISCVSLPANRESLVIGASSGARRGDAEKLSNRQLSIALRALTPVIRDTVRDMLGEKASNSSNAARLDDPAPTDDDYLARFMDDDFEAFDRDGGGDDDDEDEGDPELHDALREILADGNSRR